MFQITCFGALLSLGGLIYTSLSNSLPCRKAELMSVVFTVHSLIAAFDRNNLMASLPTVVLSLGISRSSRILLPLTWL